MPAGWVAAGAAVLGAYSSHKSSKTAADAQRESTQANIDAQKEATKIDPRIDQKLYGTGSTRKLKAGAVPTKQISINKFGEDFERDVYSPDDYEITNDTGLLGKVSDYANKPQSEAMQNIGKIAESSLVRNYAGDIETQRSAANKLMGGQIAPQMTAATINAPNQNSLNLTRSYDQFINGESGNNPFLTGAIQKGINQGTNAFQNMQSDAARNMLESILPNIRGGAIASGQYGGSRQGISESKALNDFSTQMGRAATQIGQGAIDSAINAQAGAYNQDQSNKLSATTSLGGQQYGVAGQNAGNMQQANQANMGAKISANQMNTAGLLSGIGALSGLSAADYNMADRYNNADFNRMQQSIGLLQPFAGKGSPINVPYNQPISSNTMGGAIGGATTAMGLYNMFKGNNNNTTVNNGSYNYKNPMYSSDN